ncbi:MAG: LysM domain-containing protein [Desulfitobacteriaceae bacterium]|nr:LysM domain-containing protein [Desulfitobacteriaceae bacterium]MDI6881095.1 LysM domain-containing protein [Desulfitobacteriaceae bacterium]MDI6914934.1 LysM domain-containing protein [Desulfitobacteriaceae bacterium]
MFFGKHQPVQAFSAPMPMGDGQMGMPGMAAMPGMPGMDAAGFAGPGVGESMRATCTEYAVPGYPPVHYGHAEYDVEVRPRQLVHVVRKGETVYKIAKRYGLDWREVAGYNHLGNPNLIYPGQRLLIPVR